MTALTTYLSNIAATSLPTAAAMSSATGGVLVGDSSLIGTSTGYGELYGLGTSGAWAAASNIGSPSGNGWLWDVTTLEQQTIAAGTWTPTLRVRVSNGTATIDWHVRYYKWNKNSGTYTLIGQIDQTGVAMTTLYQTLTPSVSLSAMAFGTNDKLYMHIWPNITANSTGTSAATLFITTTSSATQGDTTGAQVTPGYSPTPVALSVAMHSIGKLNPSITVKLALPPTTLKGLGVFHPTLSVNQALALTFKGLGTFAPSLAPSVPLSVTLSGIGTLKPTMTGGSVTVPLSVTVQGVGGFRAALSGGLQPLVRVVNGATIYATDVAQVVKVLQRPGGSVEMRKYVCAGNGYTGGARIQVYIATISSQSVPVSVTLDQIDQAAPAFFTNLAVGALTSEGFQVKVDLSSSGARPSGTVAGNYFTQY